MKKILLILGFGIVYAYDTSSLINSELKSIETEKQEYVLLIDCMEMAQDKETLFSCYDSPYDTDLDGEEFNRKKEFIISIKKRLFKLLQKEKICIENALSEEQIDQCKFHYNKDKKRLFIGFENPEELIKLQIENQKRINREALKREKELIKKYGTNIRVKIKHSMQRIKTLQRELSIEIKKLEELQRRAF